MNKALLIFSALSGIARGEVAATTQESSNESDPHARIARMENGLFPPIVIKGQPIPTMKIADRMAHSKVPGVSVAFFDHGQIKWTRSYGFADVAGKKPVTTETLFQAASISKPISALAALRLVQKGKLSLDDDINSKLRSWSIPKNEFTRNQKDILRRILSHSAGLTVHGFPGYGAGEPVPTVVQILNGENPANTLPIPWTRFPVRSGDIPEAASLSCSFFSLKSRAGRSPRSSRSLFYSPLG
jgi:CubicO group peptidase (beta-lactamase class C family)